MNLTDLATFTRVVELGTFAAAAEAEGVPKSTISRRVARLEDALGLELLRRSARSFTVTDDGRTLHARAAGALRELSAVEQALTSAADTPRGVLVFTAPHDFGTTEMMASLIGTFQERFPEVRVDVRLENRVVDLVQEGVDVGLRAHVGEIPGQGDLMVRRLRGSRGLWYASAALLERIGALDTPEALVGAPLVLHSSQAGRPLLLRQGDREVRLAPVEPVVRANDFGLVAGLVAEGRGVGVLPDLTGTWQGGVRGVVQVLPGWSSPGGHLSLVWPETRHLAPRVRAFLQVAVEVMGERPGRG